MIDAPGLYLAGAFAFVFNEAGEFLLLEERQDKRKYMFDLPGGTLQPDEDPIAGLRREVLEETGVELSELSPLCHLKCDRHESGRSILVAFYVAKCLRPCVKTSVEHSGHRWVTRQEYDVNGYTVSLDNRHARRLLDAYPNLG